MVTFGASIGINFYINSLFQHQIKKFGAFGGGCSASVSGSKGAFRTPSRLELHLEQITLLCVKIIRLRRGSNPQSFGCSAKSSLPNSPDFLLGIETDYKYEQGSLILPNILQIFSNGVAIYYLASANTFVPKGKAEKITADASGYGYRITAASTIEKYSPSTGLWSPVVGPINVVHVSSRAFVANTYIYVDDIGTIRTSTGQVYPSSKFHTASLGNDGSIWALNMDGKIYAWENSAWVQRPGIAKSIDVQDASRICISDHINRVYTWTGSDWQEHMDLECAQCSINTNTLYCVDPNNALFKFAL